MPTVYKYPIGRNPDEFTKSVSGGKQMTKVYEQVHKIGLYRRHCVSGKLRPTWGLEHI